MIKKLPLFYFNATLCWVDDNELFLNAANRLFKDDFNCLSFNNSEQALRFLLSYQTPSSKVSFTREFVESDLFDTHNHLPVDINISAITQLSSRSFKDDELTILIIDNNMPQINGIEICEKLIHSPYKKILLTGQTSESEIVDAFNAGIIDKFIPKDHSLSEKLQKSIIELNRQYFVEKTQNLLSHLEASRLSPLSDPQFIDFFYCWIQANEYKEFYLINRHGSFLVKDKNDLSAYFILMSESAIEEFLKLNEEAANKVGDLLIQLSRGISIPFFGIGGESWQFDYEDWYKYFFPSSVIKGREKYYWTVIQ